MRGDENSRGKVSGQYGVLRRAASKRAKAQNTTQCTCLGDALYLEKPRFLDPWLARIGRSSLSDANGAADAFSTVIKLDNLMSAARL